MSRVRILLALFVTFMGTDCNTKSEFLKKINGGVVLYLPHALARCLSIFASRYKGYPVGISLGMDISLYTIGYM